MTRDTGDTIAAFIMLVSSVGIVLVGEPTVLTVLVAAWAGHIFGRPRTAEVAL